MAINLISLVHFNIKSNYPAEGKSVINTGIGIIGIIPFLKGNLYEFVGNSRDLSFVEYTILGPILDRVSHLLLKDFPRGNKKRRKKKLRVKNRETAIHLRNLHPHFPGSLAENNSFHAVR